MERIGFWAYRTLVRLAVAAAVVAFVVVLICWQAPGALLGDTRLNQDRQPAQANPTTAGLSSVLDLSGDAPNSTPLPPRTVALTFDDGPSLEWTPKVQEVLDRQGVPGTFFVTGSQVLRHPDIVQRLDQAGHEIGNHSYTHPRMGQLPDWQARLQVTLTERAVLGVTGQRTRAFRPPYSGTIGYLPQAELDAAENASGGRYLTILSDRIPEDYEVELSVHDLVADAMPAMGAGAVITFHDGGGNRSNTVAALDEVIQRLKAAGYRFVRASELAPAPASAPTEAAPSDARLASVLVAATRAVDISTNALWYLSLTFIVLSVVRISFLVGMAALSVRRSRWALRPEPTSEPVTVVVPAYNESVGIEATVRSILLSDHPDVRVIVVDDGSTDGTADVVEALGFERVRVVRQANGGKASALRRGIAAADTEIVVMIDGDTIFERRTISELIVPFADPTVGAVAGNAKVGNRRRLIGRLQHLEYSVSSSLERRMLEQWGTATCIPGAVGAYRRSVLEAVGGPQSDTLAEDADLTMTIVRAGWRVAFAPEARAWTEAPTTVKGFYKQRRRWAYGILQALHKHRRAMLQCGPSGRLGRRVILYQAVATYFGAIIAPAIDLIILYNLLFDPGARGTSLIVWAGLNVFSIVLHAYALFVDGEQMRSAAFVPLQQIVYRHIIWLATFRALHSAVFGSHQRWNKLRRTGDVLPELQGTSVALPIHVPLPAPREPSLVHTV